MAYHSKANPFIYHTCRNCPEGNNIERINFKYGRPRNRARLCERCKELRKKGKCKPGVPFARY